jgi:HEAT repeat protein
VGVGSALLAASLCVAPPVAPAAWRGGPDTAVGPAPAAADESLGDLKVALHASRSRERRGAVKKLAQLDRRDAWRLVLESLEDPSGEVADEAQFHLATAPAEHVLDGLLGRLGLRSTDEWVRLRAAEVLGRRREALDGEEILRRVTRRDLPFTRALLRSLEQLAGAELVAGERTKIVRSLGALVRARGAAGTRAAALSALAALDPSSAAPLVREGLEDRASEVRAAALDAWETEHQPGPSPPLERLADDAELAVRRAALEVFGRAESRAAAELLIGRLEVEERERLRWRAVELLRDLSGMGYGLDVRSWRHWLERLEGDPLRGAGRRVAAAGPRTTTLVGLPILSDRVAFLIDFSGSLWYEREGGRTRKEVVEERLRETLPALDAGTRFNLIPYTSDPHPWRDELVDATPRNVRRALSWFEDCNESGTGDFFEAALLALSDPEVDTVVALTDGAPTGGRRWKLELLVPALVEANRYRGVAFDSIVVDAPPRLVRHWETLARLTGGRCVAVDL